MQTANTWEEALEQHRTEQFNKRRDEYLKRKENNNAVEHPSHYTGKIETIDYICEKLTPEQFEGYCIGNVIKYISRYKKKNGLEDLQKAQWYLSFIIAQMAAK